MNICYGCFVEYYGYGLLRARTLLPSVRTALARRRRRHRCVARVLGGGPAQRNGCCTGGAGTRSRVREGRANGPPPPPPRAPHREISRKTGRPVARAIRSARLSPTARPSFVRRILQQLPPSPQPSELPRDHVRTRLMFDLQK